MVEPKIKPHVLVIYTDDHRYSGVQILGNQLVQTPNIDALAKEGIIFRKTYLMGSFSGATCIPSRAMLLSGRQLFKLQNQGKEIPDDHTSYGLGSMNNNLPTFIVLQSKNSGGQPLYSRLWGNGFLPTKHQGGQFRSGDDPVLYLSNPENYTGEDRRRMLNYLKEMNEMQNSTYGDPEISGRIAQYEMAYRMQTSAPEIMDMSDEPDHIFEMYGKDSRDPGTYAANCLLARKLLEKDCPFCTIISPWLGSTYWPSRGN